MIYFLKTIVKSINEQQDIAERRDVVAKVLQEPLGRRMLQDVGLDLDSTFKKK